MTELDVVGLVQADLDERRDVGMERYGQLLDLDDGRDWLKEAYEEALDLLVYLRACIEKRGPATKEADPWHAIEELAKEVADLRKVQWFPPHGVPYTPGGIVKVGDGQYVPAPGRFPTITVNAP